ncbi:MAG: aspartate-semialdehyde dehydrogenase, partial [SAR202 cluster bacterium]|nr:aspartate-semialdehyde dehydrogenase [SAR202 cluster bacterium]
MSVVNVAIVGATGLVGQTFIRVLEERGFPIKQLKLLASERSIGKRLNAFGHDIPVEQATPQS